MFGEKKLAIGVKSNLQAIPVCLAAMVLWAIIGGWYVAVAPTDTSGADNIGIVLSTFGMCLFLVDRITLLWLHISTKMLFLPTWIWGLVFIVWGLLEWLHSYSRRYATIFLVHWSVFLVLIVSISIWVGRRRKNAE